MKTSHGECFSSWEEAFFHNEIISFCLRKATIKLATEWLIINIATHLHKDQVRVPDVCFNLVWHRRPLGKTSKKKKFLILKFY
jgi:hypothetical protein